MLYLDQAILTRWNATGLNVSVGTIYDTQQPEGTALPYCSYENQGDSKDMQSHASRYQKAMVQFTLWAATKEACGALCELVEAAFLHACNAITNPLNIVGIGTDSILSCQLLTPYTLLEVSDSVWQGPMTFMIEYRRDGGLKPA